MPQVLIKGGPRDADVPLTVNGTTVTIPVNVSTPVPDKFMPTLRNSGFSFEVQPDPVPPEPKPPAEQRSRFEDLDVLAPFLDRTISAIAADLHGLNAKELAEVRDAERAGKTRTTLVPLIEAELATRLAREAETTGPAGEDDTTDPAADAAQES